MVKHQNRIMIETACSLAKKTHSKGVLIYADMIEDYESLARIGQEKKTDIILAVKEETSLQEAQSVSDKVIQIPNIPLGRINQIKMAIILQALSRGIVQKGDKVGLSFRDASIQVIHNLLILELENSLKSFFLLISRLFPKS